MHSPFTACLSQKEEDNSVVVDGGAVVEFFCCLKAYLMVTCLESLESERLLYETKYLNVFFLHHQRNKNRIRSRNHNPSSLAQNRTAFFPPQHWKIDGIVNPQYKSGPPVRVDPTGFPDPSGLQATTYAFASWQVICNITKPKPKDAPFCVSYLAFYNDSVIPCNTCGCGDIDTDTCNANARQLLLPPDSLLVPFENRTLKAKVWAKRKHMAFIKKLPCPDNCGISLNWHVNSDYADGWSASVTVFNWGANAVEDWFAAVDLG
ncbi:unnamed protein product [Brassica napus]|nr:unnamed protein product [Brassica napus]